jgi:hypothetical protein
VELVLLGLSSVQREREREREGREKRFCGIVDVFGSCCGSARGFGLGVRMDAEAWGQEL